MNGKIKPAAASAHRNQRGESDKHSPHCARKHGKSYGSNDNNAAAATLTDRFCLHWATAALHCTSPAASCTSHGTLLPPPTLSRMSLLFPLSQ